MTIDLTTRTYAYRRPLTELREKDQHELNARIALANVRLMLHNPPEDNLSNIAVCYESFRRLQRSLCNPGIVWSANSLTKWVILGYHTVEWYLAYCQQEAKPRPFYKRPMPWSR